jgi:uncharacterized protein (DUF486 family)
VTGDIILAADENQECVSKGLLRFFTRGSADLLKFVFKKRMRTIGLLMLSNIFMTFAWYGHLKFKSEALWKVVLVSWGIAFFEYCFQVPANRIGYGTFTGAQLKVIQEVITLVVFAGFSVLYLGEAIKWNYVVSFLLILGAVFFAFKQWD